MKKYIFIVVFILITIYLLPEHEYKIRGKQFYVQEKSIFKLVDSGNEKIIFNSQGNSVIGSRCIFPVDNDALILNLIDGIYLYQLKPHKLQKIVGFDASCLAYSKKYNKIIFAQKNILYYADINGSNKIKIDDVYLTPALYNVMFISEDALLYNANKDDDSGIYKVYNFKNNTKSVQYPVFQRKSCFPVLYLYDNKFVCSKQIKKGYKYFIINTKSETLEPLSINPYGNYMIYLKDLQAILYTKLGLSFKGETFYTRIYFIKSQKDYLWSRKYIQPVEVP